MENLIAIAIPLLAVSLYFLPTTMAFTRGKKIKVAILALNFLLGWTLIGWVAAFVWSLTKD